jgi:hypothetical protein
MQVGMVGTDGVLIASDKRWMERSGTVWNTYNTSKFVLDHEKGLAISCANCMVTAEVIANRIILSDDWVAGYWQIARDAIASSGTGRDAHCLIASAKPSPRLFSLQIVNTPRGLEPVCKAIEDKRFAGDDKNPAIYWAERYYALRPIEELVPIAAYMILAASKLNPAGIDGLEIVLCNAFGVHLLPVEQIAALTAHSKDLESKLAGTLFKP